MTIVYGGFSKMHCPSLVCVLVNPLPKSTAGAFIKKQVIFSPPVFTELKL